MNTPEDIDAWIAERKKRFPTATRVADKKAKLEEAIARGQLPFDDNPRFAKRQRLDGSNRGASRGRGSGRSRRRNGPSGGRDGVVNAKTLTTPVQIAPGPSSLQPSLPGKPPAPVLPEGYDSSDSDDAPPEVLSTKTTKIATPEPLSPPETLQNSVDAQAKSSISEMPRGPRRPTARQPRGPPPIPFGQNTSLLKNVCVSAREVRVDYD